MDESDASGLLCVGMHETDRAQELYATECSKMNQDTSAMCTDHSNISSLLEEYNMSGTQPLKELSFGNTQHFDLQSQRMEADSEDESMPSSPDTSSTTNHDMPGYTEQNLQHIYNAYDALVDKDGPVMLSPDFIMCDETSHLEPHLTFSSDGIKIEYLDLDLDKMITFNWGLSNIISISCKWAQNIGSALITLLVESEAENSSGPVRVQFSADDLEWPRKQQKIWYLETRYQEIWKDIPSDDFAADNWSIEPSLFFPSQYFSNTEDFEDVIYPKGDPDAVSISKRDAELLLPETFVNDTIIDFYIKYLTTRIDSTEKSRYHFFNSFFFRKLADLDKDQGRAPDGRAAFLRVRKWTRKVNIFEKDFVFIPVNFSLHWSLIVVCYPGEAVTLEGGAAKLSDKLPCILHMDSLKGSHSGLKDIIQSYLSEEWKERHPESAADNLDKFLNLRFVSLELPQQDNSFDCGLFLLHYVELFLMDVPSNFNPLKIDIFSGFLSDDWFPPAEASNKRSVIQKLIHEVVTGSFQNHPKLGCSNEQLDGRHQSGNAKGKPAGDFPAQNCSVDQAELICPTRDDVHGAQSICLNDSDEKVLSASGEMNTGRVSIVAVQNLQEPGLCLPEKDTVVSLSSQDEKNVTLVDMRSEDCEVLERPSCGVSYKEPAESLLLTLDDNQKHSSQAEVKVQDIMISSCRSLSYNSEVTAYQEYSLKRSTYEVGHECYRPPQDMDTLVMLDCSKGDIGANAEMMTGGDDGNYLGENMGSATQGYISKEIAEVKREDSLVDHLIMVENAVKDNVTEIDSTADNIDNSGQYVPSELTEANVDNGMAGDISQLSVGNSDKVVSCDNAASSSVLNEGKTNQAILGGFVTYETNINADGVDGYKQLATSEAIHCEDAVAVAVPCEDTNCAMAEAVPSKDTTCTEAQDGTFPHEDTTCAMAAAVTCEDTTCTEARDGAVSREDTTYAMAKSVPCEDTSCAEAQNGTVPSEGDTICIDAEMPVGDRSCCIKDETSPENATSDAKTPLHDGICEAKAIAVPDGKFTEKDDFLGTGAKSPLPSTSTCDEEDIVPSGDKCIQEADVKVTSTERPLPDDHCEEKIVLCEEKVVSGDSSTRKDDAHVADSKRPLPEGLSEKDTSPAPERCTRKDNLHGPDAKIERHYKRRKVLAAESQKERSSSGPSSLD